MRGPGGRFVVAGHPAAGHGGPRSRDAGVGPRPRGMLGCTPSGGHSGPFSRDVVFNPSIACERPTPVGVTEISRGSSEANTPGWRPPPRSAPRRWCVKALPIEFRTVEWPPDPRAMRPGARRFSDGPPHLADTLPRVLANGPASAGWWNPPKVMRRLLRRKPPPPSWRSVNQIGG